MRLPLGIWTDRFGGRIVMTALLLTAAVPVYLVSFATRYWQLLAIGLLLGVVGASFAVGTPYCARFFPREKRGFAMGVFGAGTVSQLPGIVADFLAGEGPMLVDARVSRNVISIPYRRTVFGMD